MAPLRPRIGRRPALARQAAGLGIVVLLTVVLAQSTTAASFSAATGDTGNVVGAAVNFCTAAGTPGVTTASQDASTNGTGTNTNSTYNGTTHGTGTSTGGDGYYFIRFNLPATIPARCEVASATLSLYASTSQAATMRVYRAADGWSETTLTWNNQPAHIGTPVPLTVAGGAGWQAFPVAAHVQTMLTGDNFGFVVKDAVDLASDGRGTRYQTYHSFSNASNKPTLTITWG